MLRAVDGDELTGICYVGNQSLPALLYFVIVPTVIYLCVGIMAIAFGAFAIISASNVAAANPLRVRHGSHHSSSSSAAAGQQAAHLLSHSRVFTSCCNPQSKSDVLNGRVLIFAAFYILPAVSILAANVYDYNKRDSWYAAGSQQQPNVEIFIFKIFMSLVVGMKTGLWMWSTTRAPASLWAKVTSRFKKAPRTPTYVVTTAPRSQKQPFLTNTLEKPRVALPIPVPIVPAHHIRHTSGGKSISGGETSV